MKSERWRFALPSITASILSKVPLGDLGILCSRVSAAQECYCTQDKYKGIYWHLSEGVGREGNSSRQWCQLPLLTEASYRAHAIVIFVGISGRGEQQTMAVENWLTVSNFLCQCSMPYSELLNAFTSLGSDLQAGWGSLQSARQGVSFFLNGQSAFWRSIWSWCVAVCPLSGLSLLLVGDKGRKAALMPA